MCVRRHWTNVEPTLGKCLYWIFYVFFCYYSLIQHHRSVLPHFALDCIAHGFIHYTVNSFNPQDALKHHCDSNLRHVVDEDDNGKFRLESCTMRTLNNLSSIFFNISLFAESLEKECLLQCMKNDCDNHSPLM